MVDTDILKTVAAGGTTLILLSVLWYLVQMLKEFVTNALASMNGTALVFQNEMKNQREMFQNSLDQIQSDFIKEMRGSLIEELAKQRGEFLTEIKGQREAATSELSKQRHALMSVVQALQIANKLPPNISVDTAA